jgi:hypothetical protein
VGRGELQQAQRQADLVVQVAGISVSPVAPLQQIGGHLLGGGLADAAGNPDDAQVQQRAPMAGNGLQRLQGVLHP